MGDHCRVVTESLLAVAVLGFLVGGAIVVIDSVILRRIRRQKEDEDRR